MPGRWAPSLLFGLWVEFGHHSLARGWVRPPAARFACRHGCTYEAHGPEQVAAFTRGIDAHHARYCPGVTTNVNTQKD